MNLLHCVGVGMVARNKQTNTKVCYVYDPTNSAAGDGEISGQAEVVESKGMSKDGTPNSSKVMSSNVVPATWMNINSPNRLTPPDVRVGSKVALYRWGDDPTFYWTTYGFAGETMRLETVIYGWSANPDTGGNGEFNYDSFYVFEVSTHTGRIALRTSQANGEFAKHELALNTKSSALTYADSEDNLFLIDAKNHSFIYQNREKSKLVINRKQMLLSCQDRIMMDALNSFTLNTKELNINAKKITIIAPMTNIKGDIKQIGNLDINGGLTASEGIKATGAIHSDADVTAGDISLKKHKHGKVKSGDDTSDVAK